MILQTYITRFLYGYGYNTITEFFHSLCPSFKYQMQTQTLSLSAFFAVVGHYLGITPFIAVAMVVAVLVETLTGIRASEKRGIKFESFRFSRCIIKVFIWMVLIFVTNCFLLECEIRDGWIDKVGETFFGFVRLLILVYFLVEYIVSILENLAILDGKDKTEFIDALKELYKSFSHSIARKGGGDADY